MNSKGEKDRNPKGMSLSCVVLILICAAPFVLVFATLRKDYLDAEHAREEIERTVNPDELRAWVLDGLRKHPQGREGFMSPDDLPGTFPRFSANYAYVKLYPLDDADGWGGALLAWSFGLETLSVRVWLNADGTPKVLDEGEQQWAKGIVLSRYAK